MGRPDALVLLLAAAVTAAAMSCTAHRGEPAAGSVAPSGRDAPLRAVEAAPPKVAERAPQASGSGEPLPEDASSFKAEVAPMLAKHCAPCHVPGGTMYAKLPFDDAGIVRGHQEGVLKRLKSDEDKARLQAWLATEEKGR
jgi:hypothetical protein